MSARQASKHQKFGVKSQRQLDQRSSPTQ